MKQTIKNVKNIPYLPSCRVLGRSTSGMIIFHLRGNLLLNITLWFKSGINMASLMFPKAFTTGMKEQGGSESVVGGVGLGSHHSVCHDDWTL